MTMLPACWLLSLYRWKYLSKADRWICLLLLATVIEEYIARYYQVVYHNNFPTYHFYTPIELSIIAFYFVSSFKIKSPILWGSIICIVSCTLAALNTIYLQPLLKFNSYFLLFEGIMVISLCLIAFYKILIRDDIKPNKMVNFWLTISFLFYWSFTYVDFGVFGKLEQVSGSLVKYFTFTLSAANLLFYLSIAFVLFFYKKLIPSGE